LNEDISKTNNYKQNHFSPVEHQRIPDTLLAALREDESRESWWLDPVQGIRGHYDLAYTKNNKLDIEVEVEVEAFTEDIEILKDLQIKNLNFLQQEYDAAGNFKEKNCLLYSSIKRARY